MKKVQIGDLVRAKGIWHNMVGIVKATDNSWYVATNCVDVCNCIVSIDDIQILKKHFLPKKYHKYYK